MSSKAENTETGTENQTQVAPLVDDGSHFTHTLIVPIPQADGKSISVLTFQEPKVGDMIDTEQAGLGANAHTAATLARSCGITAIEFREICARDYNKILQKAGPWLGNG